ncbi:MAG: N-acetylglutamate synthase/glutamate N-acetyltransferase [Fibrobacteres bacterium]|nr:N-acetylglutamate synthase/glutamate N-acetyltransferase [Fibrobacterota bacterium]
MEDVSFPKGFQAWGLACGIKKNGKPDLGILVSEPPAQVFSAFTRNAVKAAPVLFDQEVASGGGKLSHVLVNSGNANACTGARGYADVTAEVALVRALAAPKGEVMVSSTGVIGEYLPMDKIKAGIARLFKKGAAEGAGETFGPFVHSIMTTDTFEKKTMKSLVLEGKEVRLGGVAKGAGMIRPNMATMLSYITTDLDLDAGYAPTFLAAVEKSFNSISVDGDMSTNDTALLLANGASGVRYASLGGEARKAFDDGLRDVMEELAKLIIRDGEGATKLVTIETVGARTSEDAKAVCRAIANSPLVKTAFFGGDANWGRVLAAAGSSGAELVPEKTALEFCGVQVMAQGGALAYDEDDLAERMKSKDVSVKVDLGLGKEAWTYWTCDLSYEYVKINAAYRT